MPIHEYEAEDTSGGCDYCRNKFEVLQKMQDRPLDACPRCAGAVVRLISPHSVGASKSGFDDKAKSAGFHKLVKSGRGEYQKKY